jgi:hypothetical protein
MSSLIHRARAHKAVKKFPGSVCSHHPNPHPRDGNGNSELPILIICDVARPVVHPHSILLQSLRFLSGPGGGTEPAEMSALNASA